MRIIEQQQPNVSIQNALSVDGEFKCGQYSLDGIDHVNKVIYEFYGCWLVKQSFFFQIKIFINVVFYLFIYQVAW